MSTAVANPAENAVISAANEEGASTGAPEQVVSFRLANEEYGLDIMGVQEIILMGEITEIPEVPEYVCGLINLRGKIIPIIDLRKRFGLEAGAPTEHTRIIVFNSGDHTFGIVVDAVNEVIRLEAGKVDPPPKGVVGIDSGYIKGLVKMEDRIMILLDSEGIISLGDQKAIASGSPDKSTGGRTETAT